MEVEGTKMQLGYTRNASATLTVQIKILTVMITMMMGTMTFIRLKIARRMIIIMMKMMMITMAIMIRKENNGNNSNKKHQ